MLEEPINSQFQKEKQANRQWQETRFEEGSYGPLGLNMGIENVARVLPSAYVFG